MNTLFADVQKNAKLVVVIGTAAVVGTIAINRLLRRRNVQKKHVPGSGPTGNGKWKLYHAHSFMSARCVWLLEEMGMMDDFEIVDYDPHTASPMEKYHYRANVHPHGLIPAMVTSEGEVMLESAAICLHLAKLYRLCLPNKDNEATFYNWCVYASATADNCIRTVYRQLYTTDEKNRDLKVLETNRVQCVEWVNCFESLLSSDNREFVCSNGFTAADAIIGYSVFWLSLIKDGALLEDTPNVGRYLSRIQSRPLWKKHMEGPNGKEPEWIALTRKQ